MAEPTEDEIKKVEDQDTLDPANVCEPVEFMDGELLEGVVANG